MLPCIAACKKHVVNDDEDHGDDDGNPSTSTEIAAAKAEVKSLSSQLRDVVLKVSAAYRQCRPCASLRSGNDEASHGQELGGTTTTSDASSSDGWVKSGGGSSGMKESTSSSSSEGNCNGKLIDQDCSQIDVDGSQEWVAQVEPGVLITFIAMANGENELKRIRFSRELFNKWQAEAWWNENCERVHELYNVSGNDRSFPNSRKEGEQDSKLKAAATTTDELTEWVEEDEPGVYITVRLGANGNRELKRVRFSREKFSERQAKLWWERNRFRIHDNYLVLEQRMKLRVRAASGGGTLRVEVPDSGTVYDLRNVLSQMIGVAADSIRLSLNKRDEIEGDSAAPLAAFGVRSGDLLYYFDADLGQSVAVVAPTIEQDRTVDQRRELCASAADKRFRKSGNKDVAAESSSGASREEEEDDNDGDLNAKETGYLGPSLFSMILAVEGQNAGKLQDFLVMAVHAVMLETGFVVVGSADNRIFWGSLGLLKYTLPELQQQEGFSVVLRCQVVGDFVVVYGSVSGSQQIHRLSLSVSKFLNDYKAGDHPSNLIAVFKDTFALWKEVKDNLTLQLLMQLCEIAGLQLPSCFPLLPTELKMRILELVPPAELGIMACVCSELRFLASNEQLWKAKFLKEFPKWKEGDPVPPSWKEGFIREWCSRRRRQRSLSSISRRDVVARHHFRRPMRNPNPWGIIGGDYDLYPNLAAPPGRSGINPFGGSPRFLHRSLIHGNVGPASSTIGSGLIWGSDGPDDELGLARLPRPGENP